ncbi:putative cytochrome c-like domain-containing protein [Helianthus annuus]|nr:putative cytochrome c-like domain-containing protein [Helianthus annuus]
MLIFLLSFLCLIIWRGASLFNRACIGCHDAGGNILQPVSEFLQSIKKTIINNLINSHALSSVCSSRVQLCFSKIFKGMANGIDTEEEIYRITYYVKGRMLMCTPRVQCTFGARLQEDGIRLLADFVKSQADQGWPTIVNSGGGSVVRCRDSFSRAIVGELSPSLTGFFFFFFFFFFV